MNGDIKLATLSDTDATNVTGAELVTNGTFDSNTTGWTVNSNGTVTSVSGRGRVTNTQSGDRVRANSVAMTTVVGKHYTLSFETYNSGGFLHLGNTSGGVEYGANLGLNGNGTFTHTFEATGTEAHIQVGTSSTTNGQYAEYDNISLRLAEPDRSYNANGLQVFGTVTKTAVATGADLVAYSGFSTSNYLQQPYNSSLGLSSTDDLTIMCWVKQASHTGTIQVIFASGVMSGGQGRYLYTNAGIPRLDTFGGATNNSTRDITDNTWHHLTAIYTPNGIGYMYIDGILDATPSLTAGYINQSGGADVRIGIERNNTLPTNASISLLRVSNSVPTPEQIAKIYNDEKFLFQENAKATLYGSSDAVTALAYDDDTDLLHVGTSAGRSDFQGLRRINNTTRAIGTAISAVDGFIVEE